MRIILDTNFLMIPGQHRIDIFEEIKKIMQEPYTLYIFEATKEELDKIAKSNKKDKNNAKIALALIKQKNLKTLKNSFRENKYIDEIILNNITDSDVVCTQDKGLKALLRNKFPRLKIIMLSKKLIMR